MTDLPPETQRAVERLVAEIDAEMSGRQRGYADARGELLFRCRDALSELQAREAVLEGALKAFIGWGQQQCPCQDETPDPCPLCDATVAAGRCKAVEAKFPPRILADARTALFRTTPTQEQPQ